MSFVALESLWHEYYFDLQQKELIVVKEVLLVVFGLQKERKLEVLIMNFDLRLFIEAKNFSLK